MNVHIAVFPWENDFLQRACVCFPQLIPCLKCYFRSPLIFCQWVKQHKHQASTISLKNYGPHSSSSNLGHYRPAFSGWEHQVAYGGWIRALVTMATSYHSSSAAAIFYPKQCFVHTGGFALKWLYYVLFILHTVRVSTSRVGIPVRGR